MSAAGAGVIAVGARAMGGGAADVAAPSSPSTEFLRLIPRDFARDHLILSAGRDDGVELLHITDRTGPAAVFNVGVRLRVPVRTNVVNGEALARAIDAAYAAAPGPESPTAAGAETGMASADDIDRLLAAADKDLLSTQGKGPVVRLVDAMLLEALGLGASDLHVHPLADRVLVRYRVDGVLHTARELNARLAQAVISRIKVMGRMDIAERRLPQDGRASVTIGADDAGRGRTVDLRISTLPTSFGERAVVRLLDQFRNEVLTSFDSIGMPPGTRERYMRCAMRPNGIVLMTGPTGSGKTTTLYATLRHLAEQGGSDRNIMTIEDPIEYDLSSRGGSAADAAGLAISQSQVSSRKGITFATGLRHILRQDPDVVMVGEIRDAETARVAIQASLTGHLVFSTLHTNDAPSAVTRLIDLGVEPYLVGASLSAVLAQRLVRRVHLECRGEGCGRCFGSGLLGRIGLYELLVVDESVRACVSRGAALAEIRAAALAGGMRTLAQEGERLVNEGISTRVEVASVVQEEA